MRIEYHVRQVGMIILNRFGACCKWLSQKNCIIWLKVVPIFAWVLSKMSARIDLSRSLVKGRQSLAPAWIRKSNSAPLLENQIVLN